MSNNGKLDLSKLGRIIALVSSDQDGEALTAARTADRLVRSSGMTWLDFVEAYRRAELATEAAAVLLAENTALRAELDQLRSVGTAVAIWQEVGAAKVSDIGAAARWGLDLHHRGRVYPSTNFEFPFLTRCSTWSGRLTPKMQPIFDRILRHIVERTGETPPV